ncbi:succinate dehydrogenase cytochrome b558 subunit [Thermicanus aegyptius]|uniref:succinate dehydrogenase cytochrome b558 subunit n=1 Tax=Thermicanus aegyptius TaxID=94009 RepID=UPI00041258A7|nr:succinate dehydrogenase cytochrome b558 subunit [Thermicanus aegyptius]
MSDGQFVNRRLHSLLGIIPIGLFLIEHLVSNYSATGGPEKFNQTVSFIQSLPFLVFLEIFLIFIPILFHGIYGVYIAFQAKHNVNQYGYFRNVMFLLQRVTGLITLVYIGWHVWETRIQSAFFGAEVNFDMMKNILSNPWMVAFYVVGILSATFHFSNGIWSFLVSWGITVGPRAQRVSTYVSMAIFVILSIIGLMALFAFVNPVSGTALN